MPAPLTLTRIRRPAPPHVPAPAVDVLTAVGEIDLSNADALARALDATPGPVVLDLTGVGYLDSAGLNVLFARAPRLRLVVGPLLAPVVAVSGLAAVLPVHPAPPPASAPDGPVPPDERV